MIAVISGTGAGLVWDCPLAGRVLAAAGSPWDALSVEMVQPAVGLPLLDKKSDTIDGVATPPPMSHTTGQFNNVLKEHDFAQCLVNPSSDLAGNDPGFEKQALESMKTCQQSSSTTIAG